MLSSFVFLQEGFVIIPSQSTASVDIYAYELSAKTGTFQGILSFALPKPIMGLSFHKIFVDSQATNPPSRKDSESPVLEPLAPSSLAPGDVVQPEPSRGHLHPPRASRPLGIPLVPLTSSLDDAIVLVSVGYHALLGGMK